MSSTQSSSVTSTQGSRTEVLVVGGGPTGLSAALALGRLGVEAVVVERRATTSTHPRGHVENGRTMELLRTWGVERRVREAGLPREFLAGVTFMTRLAGIELGNIRFSDDCEWLMGHDGHGPASLSSTPQDRLEPILLDAVSAQLRVSMRFGTEVTDLQSHPEGVTAKLRDENGTSQELRADYAIVADGSRSRIREQLGIGVDGPGTLGAQLGIYFHADLSRWVSPRPSALYWLYNPDVQGVIISLDGKERWHLLFAYDQERESVEDYPPERCSALVRELIGSPDADVDIRSVLPWRMRAAVAQQFRADKIFLAGDAAHTMPPTGGMGMNTGIGDVHNLAWKLHAVLRDLAGPELLETYESERQPVGRRNTDNSVRNAQTMMESGLAGILVSDPEGFAHIEQPEGQHLRDRMAAAVPSQVEHFCFDGLSFGYYYDSSSVIPDGTAAIDSSVGTYRPTARPGSRAPHAWLERDGKELSTIDLFDGRFVLLSPGRLWAEAARRLAPQLAVSLEGYHISPDQKGDLHDPAGTWAELYGVGSEGAVVVRPDGHVAWRVTSASTEPEQQLRQVLQTVLHRPTVSVRR